MLKPNEAKMLFTIYVIMILLLRLMGGGLFYADSTWAVCHADKHSGGAARSIGDEYAVLHHRLLHLQWGCAVSDVFPSGRHLRCIAHQKTEKRQRMVWVAVAMAAVSFAAMFGVGLFLKAAIPQDFC